MTRAAALLLLLAGVLWGEPAAAVPASAVDPFVGVDRGGVFPGAATPFGFAAPGPDMAGGSSAGYRTAGPVLGFSQTHVSGVGGGGSKYGNFRLTPVTGALRIPATIGTLTRERARPGFYGARLASGTRVELTASRLAAVHRYRFPASGRRHLLLDATSVVEVPGGQVPFGSAVRIRGRRAIAGWARIGGGFNGGPYRLHFVVRFSRPFARAGTFAGGRLARRRAARTGRGRRGGAWVSFPARGARTVEARVGLSFRGERYARRRAGSAGFGRTARRAARAWRRALAPIAVRGGTRGERRMLAAALYRSQLMPHDLTGDNAWWRSRAPHYEDLYTLWDTFRTLHPLLTVIRPRRQRDIVRSLIDTARHTGGLPDGRVAGKNGVTQVGSSGSVVIGDAAAKRLGGIDWGSAWRVVRRDAEVDSRSALRQGRELSEYRRLGFLSLAAGRSASRTLEYAHNDFATAQVASRAGRAAAAGRYRQRSLNWARLWDPSAEAIRPRHADGRSLAPFDVDHPYPDGAQDAFSSPFFEGTARQWSTFVPHDVGGLIRRLGGDARFVGWLDRLFDGGHYTQANQPDLLAPYLYIHAGRPDRTADRVRAILASQYRPARAGLPGEDDAGSLSSWYVWSAIGLFPNAGQAFYYVGSPLFARTRIRVGRGRTFSIEAPATSGERRYVRGARLNGRTLGRAFITHRELMRGGRLRLEMTDRPSPFGSGERPPSLTR